MTLGDAPWAHVPDGWDLQPLLAVADERQVRNTGMAETNLLSLSYGRIVRRDIDGLDGLLPASFETYQIVEPGDVVCRFTDLQNDKRSLRTGLVTERGIITSAYTALKPRCFPRWMSYLLRAYDYQKVFYGFGGGVRQSLKFADVRRLPILLPPEEEQRAIADFLDRETAQIDAMVDAQERLVALLEERRRSSILHAVTKGLSEQPRLVSSGSDLLGDIPEHWSISRMRTAVSRKKEIVGDRWSDYLLLSLTLNGIVPRDLENVVGKMPADFTTYQAVDRDDVVFCLFDVEETPRTVGWVPGRGMVTGAYTATRVREGFCPKFVAYHYQAFDQIKAYRRFYAGLRNTIRWSDFSNIPIATPPVEEQRQVADYLDTVTARIDAMIAKAQESIALMKERRAAVISAAVTGRIDVRTGIEQVERDLEEARA